jgi:membrane-bound lytic murein transglycosylase D
MMKLLAMAPLLLGFVVSGCASHKKETVKTAYNPSVAEQAEYYRVQEQLIEKDLPNCKGCIHGSSHQQTFVTPLKIYEIEQAAAVELGLHNTQFDIPVTWNKQVAMWVKYFNGKGRRHFVNYTQRAGRYAPVLSKIMADNGLPRDLIYLAMAESGFQNHARSWAKAVGPWQFMPATGKKFGLNIDWYVDERRDPLKATIAAANYLKVLNNLFGSWELATAAYNAGEGKVGRAIKMYHTKDFWKLTQGRYLRPETKNYVPKIMALAIIGKNLDVFGFSEEVQFEKALDYEEIMVKGNADLYEVAEVLELDFEEVKRYNPEITRWQTPPYLEGYPLRVPVGAKEAWDEYKDKDSVVSDSFKTYVTNGQSSLDQVSKKFKVPVSVLAALNPEIGYSRIAPRTVVQLPFREDHSLKASMYADIYEKSTKRERRGKHYGRTISSYGKKGKFIKNPSVYYTVKKGDTLWRVAQRTGVPMSTIIRTNSHLIKRRMILPGDKLAIR